MPVATGLVIAPARPPGGELTDPAGRVFVTGGPGRTGVDTEELHAVGESLARACDHLRAARGWAEDARAHLDTWSHLAPAETAVTNRAVTDCVEGPQGCVVLEARAEDLVLHLRRARALYTEAERHAAGPFRPSVLKHARLTNPALRPLGIPVSPRVLGLVAEGLTTLAAGVASPLPHAVLAQQAVREAADELQHLYPYRRGASVRLRGELVDPADHTPVQRVALGILPTLGALPAAAPLGRTLLEGGTAVRLSAATLPPTATPPATATLPSSPTTPHPAPPPAVSAPLGVRRGTSAALLPVREPRPPRSEAELLRRAERLGDHARRTRAGMVEILRSTDVDGDRSWTVIVPGTQHQLPGGPSPMDNLTNLQAMAGAVSDMEVAVATAMRQAGVGRAEPVAMAVHSQGALVAARLLRDPLFASRYRVSTLLTAGGPVGGLSLPPSVATLSLEDVEDPVVALDGLANAPADNHLTVSVDTRGLVTDAHPHSLRSYATAAGLLDGVADPTVRAWREQNRTTMGVERPGAVTDSMVFAVVRPG
ncbi:hypothetical protein PU560_15015 [Georgenia sp. 10Sc9-8]|uniref:Alpha/beta hydrolase n=1 Tax=Georgenia halotolerans TaxID=3028317 RepID=A0ABT5U0B8_9MICO|nr:hypothetical protein [Georgenia halotolerans]